MNWMRRLPPGVRNFFARKKVVPENFWVKCPISGQLVSRFELEENQFVIPDSGHHMAIEPAVRFKSFFDDGVFELVESNLPIQNPLKLRGYSDRLKKARRESEQSCAILVGFGCVRGIPIIAAAHDFRFIGGTLGVAEGEALIAASKAALMHRTPLVIFVASGGARVHEGIMSLMQMPRVTIAIQKMREAKLPYIVVFTNPSMGGVTASYGMLGDINLAEPGALVGFAGARVIKQITGEDMPPKTQSAEFVSAHGMIDMVVHRHNLREYIGRICGLLMKTKILATV